MEENRRAVFPKSIRMRRLASSGTATTSPTLIVGVKLIQTWASHNHLPYLRRVVEIVKPSLTSLPTSSIIILLPDWGRQALTGALTSVAMHAGLPYAAR